MKFLFKPFSLVVGLIAARLGKAIFKALWSQVDNREPPETTAPEATFPKVVGAAALEAVTMASVAAAADRAAAEAFHYLTGVWPGKPAEEQDS